MTAFLLRRFVKRAEQTSDKAVRRAYGLLGGVTACRSWRTPAISFRIWARRS